MKILNTIDEVRQQVKSWKSQGETIGFVPTMGYLHEGHESLIKNSVKENSKTVVSIFVNPIQFGPKEDLSTYPRDLEADSKLCENAGVDLIFAPTPEEMYCKDFSTFVDTDKVTKELCGKSRPTHFRGVCTVVNKLFNIVTPDNAYFGEKDAQQLAVIKRMVRDLSMDVKVIGCPIIRESDGLAKSSRNTYLSAEERESALVLSKAIFAGKALVLSGEKSASKLISAMTEIIKINPLAKIDYIQVVNAETVENINEIEGHILVAIAVYIGKTRLIDNFIFEI